MVNQFQYDAANSEGQAIAGTIAAATERDAARQLRQQDLTPIRLTPVAVATPPVPGFRRKRASAEDKALIMRELATLLESGVTLAEAVSSIAQARGSDVLGQAFGRMHARLRAGESFSSALAADEVSVPDFLLQLARAGEQTGKLGQALESAAQQMEYEERVRQEMKSALIYPVILVISGISATLLVFIVVVPKFANMLKSTHSELPWISTAVLATGMFVKDNLLALSMAASLVAAVGASLLARPTIRDRLLTAVARLPLAGSWLIETDVGRWAAMFSTLLQNRVPILRAMELAQTGVRLSLLRQHLQQAMRAVRGGRKVADALSGSRFFDATAINLIRTGERSGQLAAMLATLARLRERKGKERLRRFLILIEPTAILIIGGVIGTIMIAIMLAITSLSNVTF